MSAEKEKQPEKSGVGLQRELGLVSAVNFLINIIVGSGIFVTPGKVLAECGSIGMMLTIWTVCGIISFITSLPFGELSTVVPKSGGIYIFLQAAFSSYHPFFGQLPAFVYFWITYIIMAPCSTAVSALLFADYSFLILKLFMSEAFMNNEAIIKHTLGASALVFIAVINCVSVKAYVKAQDWLTFTKIGAIMFTVGCGIYMFISGGAKENYTGFEGSNLSIHGLTQAMYFGLYAYDGGHAITGITEELKRPEKNILYSILIALSITTAIYLLLNIAFLSALSQAEISNGTTVIADFAKKLFGPSGGAIAASIICISLLTSLMSGTFLNSRTGYVAAREGHILKTLCCIHKTAHTPAPAVIAQIFLSLFFFFLGGDITFLIDMNSFLMWIAYGATMVALFTLRKKLPNAYRPFRVPSIIPVLVIVISSYIVVVSLCFTDLHMIIAFIFTVILVIMLYYIFIYKNYKIKNLDMMQIKLQSLLQLVPPDDYTS